jgi:hypothetical protein
MARGRAAREDLPHTTPAEVLRRQGWLASRAPSGRLLYVLPPHGAVCERLRNTYVTAGRPTPGLAISGRAVPFFSCSGRPAQGYSTWLREKLLQRRGGFALP